MIVVDTSALMAIINGEAEALACRDAAEAHEEILVAAGTLTEALMVASGRGLHGEMSQLIADLSLSVVPLTEERAYAAVRAHMSWGRGAHEARLNFGDCFAYALAREHDCPLLFVGEDFSKTDVESALGR